MKTKNNMFQGKILVVISNPLNPQKRKEEIDQKYPDATIVFVLHKASQQERIGTTLRLLKRRAVLFLDESLDKGAKRFYRRKVINKEVILTPGPATTDLVVVVSNDHPRHECGFRGGPPKSNEVPEPR